MTQPTPDCAFCPVYRRPGIGARSRVPHLVWPQVLADHVIVRESASGLRHGIFEPRDPVVSGHMLVVPETHVPDAGANPRVTAGAMEVAAAYAASRFDFYNLITSVGAPATQTVPHLHIHVVPRSDNDRLHLPWTGQRT